jgi:uncharacterized protein
MSTNATLLTDADIQLISRENIRTQVSIDGPKDIHDRHRRFRDGKGSFEASMNNALRLLHTATAPIMVRSTMSAGTYHFPKMMDFFVDQGFKNVSIRPSEENNRSSVHVGHDDLANFNAVLDSAAMSVLRAWKRRVWCEPFNENVDLLRTGQFKPFVCAAGCMALCVDPNGWVYPCHRFQGYDEYRLGKAGSELNFAVCRSFPSLNTEYIPECSRCWARKLCCGCCPAESVAFGLSPGRPNLNGCSARKSEALLSLKLAAAIGIMEPSPKGAM